jgi:hypothetical protein
MGGFLMRLLIVVLVCWLVQLILELAKLKEPIQRIVLVITVIVGIMFLIFGVSDLPLK